MKIESTYFKRSNLYKHLGIIQVANLHGLAETMFSYFNEVGDLGSKFLYYLRTLESIRDVLF